MDTDSLFKEVDDALAAEYLATPWIDQAAVDKLAFAQSYNKGLGVLATQRAAPFHTLSFEDQKRAVLHYVRNGISSSSSGFNPQVLFQDHMDPAMVSDIQKRIKEAFAHAVNRANCEEDIDKVLQTHVCPGGTPTNFRFTKERTCDAYVCVSCIGIRPSAEYVINSNLCCYIGFLATSKDAMISFELSRIKGAIKNMHGSMSVDKIIETLKSS